MIYHLIMGLIGILVLGVVLGLIVTIAYKIFKFLTRK